MGSQSDSNCQIATPPLEIPNSHLIQYQMARMFNFPPQTSLHYLSGAEINMNSLLDSMVATDKSEMHWPRLLALCLYSQFLLILPSGDCDPKILFVLDQVEAGQNPFPLILAETIQGLDKFAETMCFFGSPMLLEVSSSLFDSLSLSHFSFCSSVILRRLGFMKN